MNIDFRVERSKVGNSQKADTTRFCSRAALSLAVFFGFLTVAFGQTTNPNGSSLPVMIHASNHQVIAISGQAAYRSAASQTFYPLVAGTLLLGNEFIRVDSPVVNLLMLCEGDSSSKSIVRSSDTTTASLCNYNASGNARAAQPPFRSQTGVDMPAILQPNTTALQPVSSGASTVVKWQAAENAINYTVELWRDDKAQHRSTTINTSLELPADLANHQSERYSYTLQVRANFADGRSFNYTVTSFEVLSNNEDVQLQQQLEQLEVLNALDENNLLDTHFSRATIYSHFGLYLAAQQELKLYYLKLRRTILPNPEDSQRKTIAGQLLEAELHLATQGASEALKLYTNMYINPTVTTPQKIQVLKRLSELTTGEQRGHYLAELQALR